MIDVLPPELLASVFLLIVTESRYFHTHTHTNKRPPWILGHVCSKWRAVAHSEPLLWCDFTLKSKVLNGVSIISRLEELLPFGLKSIELVRYDLDEIIFPSLTLINFANLRRIHLKTWFEPLVRILEALPLSLPLLEDLGLVFLCRPEITQPEDDFRERLQHVRLSCCAQNLRRLTFYLSKKLMQSFKPCIQWSVLTYLDLSSMWIEDVETSLGDVAFNDFVDILSHCMVLETLLCSLACHFIPIEIQAQGPPWSFSAVTSEGPNIVLPHLRSLDIHLRQPFLPLPSFPWVQLRELTLRNTLPPSLYWILRQTPHLELLALGDYEVSEVDHAEWPPVILASLYSLSLLHKSLQLLDYLSAPNIITLRITKTSYDSCWERLEPFDAKGILNFIRRSTSESKISPSLRTLYYDTRVEDLNTKECRLLRDLLTALPSLREFSAPRLLFTKSMLNSLKTGRKLLPKLQAVEFMVGSPSVFVDFLEARVNKGFDEEGFLRLKEGYGCYYRSSCPKDGIKGMENARKRLQALNGRYGTDFRFVEVKKGWNKGYRGDFT